MRTLLDFVMVSAYWLPLTSSLPSEKYTRSSIISEVDDLHAQQTSSLVAIEELKEDLLPQLDGLKKYITITTNDGDPEGTD